MSCQVTSELLVKVSHTLTSLVDTYLPITYSYLSNWAINLTEANHVFSTTCHPTDNTDYELAKEKIDYYSRNYE